MSPKPWDPPGFCRPTITSLPGAINSEDNEVDQDGARILVDLQNKWKWDEPKIAWKQEKQARKDVFFFFVWSGALYEVFVCFRSFCIHRPWWMVFSVPQSPNWPSRNYPQFFSWKTHSAICNNQKPSETIQHVEIYNQKSFLSPTDIYDFNKFRHAICVIEKMVFHDIFIAISIRSSRCLFAGSQVLEPNSRNIPF